MATVADGYYFMFEIGWFMDLLIPTIVRIKDGNFYLVGSKQSECKDIKPCCIPAGGAQECKKLSPDDPAIKAFKSADSLLPVDDLDDLESALEKSLENHEMRDRYLNSPAKKKREAIIERIVNDYQVLSMIDIKDQ
jgi:hypothetical protein